jgi:DNA polymerase
MHLSCDIETFSSIDLKKQGLHRYIEAPDFEILLFAYSVDGGPVEIVDLTKEPLPDWIIRALCDPAVVKFAFNAQFEYTCLSKFYLTHYEKWYCTMNHALYCGLPNSLFQVCEALNLATDKRKLGVGGALIRTFCCPVKPTKSNGMKTRIVGADEPEKWELFKTYCKKDVEAEMEVYEKIKMFQIPKWEREFVGIDHYINRNGVLVDKGLLRGALACDESIVAELTAEAIALTGVINPNSRKQLLLWLSREMGEEVDSLTKDSVKSILGRGTLDSVAERVLHIRQELAKTSIAKYGAMARGICEDGRLRGIVQYYGANRTGRYAGRAVQMQNLPKNFLEPLGVARELVKAGNVEGVKLIFGNVPHTLSQLLRTAFIPPRGKLLAVADFAAIEARVIAWMAGEKWRQDVFAGDGKIYEASAAAMFGVGVETIVKGGLNYDLRAKGKVAELACGYQGSVGALKAMGADKMGLDDNQLQEIVDAWRSANPSIVELWYRLQDKVIDTIKTGRVNTFKGLTFRREIDYKARVDFLTIELPSLRKLFYAYPRLGVNKWGGESIAYMGMNQTSKKWELIETYGGKLVENCLRGNSLVLCFEGWKRLDMVTQNDSVWDGEEWVNHGGLVCKGIQEVIKIDGVGMTPDHEILTDRGWIRASQSEGFNRAKVKLPDSYTIRGVKRQKVAVGSTVRLRGFKSYGGERVQKRKDKILWVYAKRADRQSPTEARFCGPQSVCGLALYGRPLQTSYPPSVEELRGSRNKSMRFLGRSFYELLGGYGARIHRRLGVGQDRQQWSLRTKQLPMVYSHRAGSEQTGKPPSGECLWFSNCGRIKPNVGYWGNYTAVSSSTQLPKRKVAGHTRRYEQVYDIVDCGPRHRFTVLGDSGAFIVHNCTQAIARDCLCVALRRTYEAGFRIAFHVHDEVICEVEHGETDLKRICEIMGEPIPWAPGLILTASGFVGEYYKKEG